MSELIEIEYRKNEEEKLMNERKKYYLSEKMVEWKNDIMSEEREKIDEIKKEKEKNKEMEDRD